MSRCPYFKDKLLEGAAGIEPALQPLVRNVRFALTKTCISRKGCFLDLLEDAPITHSFNRSKASGSLQ